MKDKWKQRGEWNDSLLWCPSQCSLNITYGGKYWVIYLRWRHTNPWTATLIHTNNQFDMIEGEWYQLEIPPFTDSCDLNELKAAAIKQAKLKAKSLTQTELKPTI